jgi:nucleoside-diphosphate-sugar epimerase
MSRITVLGGSGFIGSHLIKRISELDIEYYDPPRDKSLTGQQLGDVIYCIGLTADFRAKPFETVEAHVCKLREILLTCEFDSLLYLSSTRVYGSARTSVAREEDVLHVAPLLSDDLYNISKAMGESLSLACGRRTSVARLSNVYGSDLSSDNFLSSIVRDALIRKTITLQTSLDSEKDYVSINEVVDLLIKIVRCGGERIYNIASGRNVSTLALTNKLRDLTSCRVEVAPGAPTIKFPRINIDRIKEQFQFQPSDILDDLKTLISLFKEETKANAS